MSFYQQIISEIDPTVDARGVEANMRLQYGTLGHLPRSVFRQEVELFKVCVRQQPDYAERVKRSMGL